MERREWGRRAGLGLPGRDEADHEISAALESACLDALDLDGAVPAQAEVQDGFAEFWRAIPGLAELQAAPPAVQRLTAAGGNPQDAGLRAAAALAGAERPAKEHD